MSHDTRVFHAENGFLRNEARNLPHLAEGGLDASRGVVRAGAEDNFLAVEYGPVKRFLGNVDADVMLGFHKIA